MNHIFLALLVLFCTLMPPIASGQLTVKPAHSQGQESISSDRQGSSTLKRQNSALLEDADNTTLPTLFTSSNTTPPAERVQTAFIMEEEPTTDKPHPPSAFGESHNGSHTTLKKELTVGVLRNSPPVAFVSDQGAVRGLAVDLAVLLGAALKMKVILRQGTLRELEDMLWNGSIDVICGVPSQKWSDPTLLTQVTPFALNRHILVASPDIHITCEQDFHGRKLAVLAFDIYAERAKEAGAKVTLVDSYLTGLNSLRNGEVEAFVAQSGEIASYLVQRNGMDSVRIMGLSLERVPLVLMVSRLGNDMSALVNSTLLRLENEGKLDLLREKWLGRSLHHKGFFETYQAIILYIALSILAIFLITVVWVFLLRRKVHAVTARLQSSERRYRELIEASPDMVLLTTRSGHIRLANRVAREALPMKEPEFTDTADALLQVFCDTGRLCLNQLLKKAKPGRIIQEELVLNPGTDKQKYMEFIATVTDDAGSGEELVCWIGRDMTHRRRIEQELIQFERLATVGKLAASVAHEINNPLGIIMTNTEVALESATDNELRNHLETIRRNVERAAATTRRLLNSAMPSSINQEPQDLADIIHESLTFLRPQMRKLSIDTNSLQDTLPIIGDRLLLEQLYVNLLLNAMDSMGEEGTLTIRSGMQKDENETTIRIEICDSGTGIPRENLERIFDIFFTTRKSKGFGLGLFISRHITESHGGKLYAESEIGKGACFIMEFPAIA